MAQDRNGNNHKAAGRPDGGQFDKKAGQGSDDDLEFGGYVAGLDAAADRTAIKERPETLSADDWRVLRRSASWGVRMLAWSSPKSPTPTDDEFDELLYDESQRVRGAAAYRERCGTLGAEVAVHVGPDAVVTGLATDVDERGCLVVATDAGPRTFAAGDVVHLRRPGR